jgi:hypothetical protein
MITHTPVSTHRPVMPQGALARFTTSLREASSAVQAMFAVRADMRRQADECAATRPELAARLRTAASQSWAE